MLSLLEEERRPFSDRLQMRLNTLPHGEILVSIVSFQEHTKGWLAYINNAKTDDGVLHGYARLARVLELYCNSQVVPFDQTALGCWHELKKQRVRVGTRDLRIAAIALARNATLLSRNLRDFRKVPGLVVEDWTL